MIKKINVVQSIKVLFVAVMLICSASVHAQINPTWTPPSGTPSNANNVLGPINVGPEYQEHAGDFEVGQDFTVDGNELNTGNVNIFGDGNNDGSGSLFIGHAPSAYPFPNNSLTVGNPLSTTIFPLPDDSLTIYNLGTLSSAHSGPSMGGPVCVDSNGTLTTNCPASSGSTLPTGSNYDTLRWVTPRVGPAGWADTNILQTLDTGIKVTGAAQVTGLGNGTSTQPLCADQSGNLTVVCPPVVTGGTLPAVGALGNVLTNVAGIWTSAPLPASGTVGGGLPAGGPNWPVLHYISTGPGAGTWAPSTAISDNTGSVTISTPLILPTIHSLTPGTAIDSDPVCYSNSSNPLNPGTLIPCPPASGTLPAVGTVGNVLTNVSGSWASAPLPTSGTVGGGLPNGGSQLGQTLYWDPTGTPQWRPTTTLTTFNGMGIQVTGTSVVSGLSTTGSLKVNGTVTIPLLNSTLCTGPSGSVISCGAVTNPGGVLPVGTTNHTLRWNGTAWVDAGTLLQTTTTGITTSGTAAIGTAGQATALTVNGTATSTFNQPVTVTGAIKNTPLASASGVGLVCADTNGNLTRCSGGTLPASPATFTTSGSSLIIPANVSYIKVVSVGGGGGGGNSYSSGLTASGGGGGAGGVTSGYMNVVPGWEYTITIGAGGSATHSGGASSLDGTLFIAGGGGAGGDATQPSGTSGGGGASGGGNAGAGTNGGGTGNAGGGAGGTNGTGAGNGGIGGGVINGNQQAPGSGSHGSITITYIR